MGNHEGWNWCIFKQFRYLHIWEPHDLADSHSNIQVRELFTLKPTTLMFNFVVVAKIYFTLHFVISLQGRRMPSTFHFFFDEQNSSNQMNQFWYFYSGFTNSKIKYLLQTKLWSSLKSHSVNEQVTRIWASWKLTCPGNYWVLVCEKNSERPLWRGQGLF